MVGRPVVGRAPECDLRLDESGLSRQHARLLPTDEGVQVEDLGSTNGSFINGKRVQRGLARTGDEIGFDTLRFRLTRAGAGRTRRHEPRSAPAAVAVAVASRIGGCAVWPGDLVAALLR